MVDLGGGVEDFEDESRVIGGLDLAVFQDGNGTVRGQNNAGSILRAAPCLDDILQDI